MTLSNVHLDSHLVTDMRRHLVLAPPLDPRNIRLRQTPHPTSVATVLLRRSLESAEVKFQSAGGGIQSALFDEFTRES
jgi:hypothetical protein